MIFSIRIKTLVDGHTDDVVWVEGGSMTAAMRKADKHIAGYAAFELSRKISKSSSCIFIDVVLGDLIDG